MEHWDKIVKWAMGAAGAIVGLFGGWDLPLKILVCLMVADYITGVVVAIAHRSRKTDSGGLSSKAGLIGLLKKGMILAVVLVASMVDQLTGAAVVRQATCLFFVANEGLSILENAGLLGVPMPRALKRVLEQLDAKNDTGEDENV